MTLPDLQRVEIESSDELWSWLAENHAQADGILLITFKKADGDRYVSRDEVLDALIAHGWIDGRRYVIDDHRTCQLITPRRERNWAASYRDRAAKLIAEGRMQPPGAASIERAKADGTWEVMTDVDALEVPDDLAAAFDVEARRFFDNAAPSYRRNVLRWLAKAKTDATRTKRIHSIVDASRAGRRLPQM